MATALGMARARVNRKTRAAHEVRHTEAWEHETFAEEQARWERGDHEYARICEEVRSAEGDEASRRADEVKAKWDVCAAPQRQADDAAERVRHVEQPRLSHGPSKLEVE